MPYFGYSRYPANVRTRSIIRFVSSAFCSPSGKARKRSSSSCSFFKASCRPCSKRRSPAPGSKFLMLPRIMGTSMVGRSLQRGLVMSISPTPRMPYLSSQAWMASRASRPPASLGSSSRKPSSSTCSQKGHHVRMRADHVRDVQERQPHLRRDVVRDRLRERVGRVLLAQPRLQLVVEPPRGLHPRHDHLHASRIELDPLQLLDVRQDEVEQRRSGLRLDVALQRGDGRLAALDQLGEDGRIGLDRGGRAAARRRPGGAFVRERRDEVAAVEDGLQRVPDQRIGFPEDPDEARAARRRSQASG